jgi:hypothetical protein
MKKIYKHLGMVLLIGSLLISCSSSSINAKNFIQTNRVIYLGYASIFGDGNTSILEADAVNTIRIRTESTSEVVDLYINYDMKCNGLVDEGIITLTISLGGENLSANATQTPTSKNGTLYLHDIEIQRGDSLGFIISAVYGNLLPIYHNETIATGIMVVSKNLHFRSLLETHNPHIYQYISSIKNLKL